VNSANQAGNAADELSRAAACLEEARTLLAADLRFGAVSRAYYAAFHAVRALLFSKGLEVRSHRAAFGLLSEHFVKPGRFSAELARSAAHLQRDREDADYMTAAVVTAEQARSTVADAARVLDEATKLLAGG
jgi:uncharacterized protein (UPF0332 family)